MDSSPWQASAKMDPELEAVLPNLPPGKSFAEYPDVPTLRKSFEEQIAQGIAAGIFKPADLTGINKQEIQIPTRDGTPIRALHYRPENAQNGPLFVYFHGGGWVFGPAEAWEPGVEIISKQLNFVVVSIDYRLAPEHLFPTASNDAWDSVKWVAQNAAKLGADPSKGFIVGGTSAGGNLASVVAHEAADSKLSPPLTGQYLSVPCLLHPDAVPEKYKAHYKSWEQNKDAIILDQRGMRWFWGQYQADPKSHLISPLNWPSGHKTQPPAFMQICGMDPLRDEALIYEHVLREECGIPTKLCLYAGLPHAGPDFLPMLSQTKQAFTDIKSGFEWLLTQKA